MAKRRLLATVVTSRLLYAAPVWAARASKYGVNDAALGRAQRLAALRITHCYRTVSTAAALFLAEMPPADLLAVERETVRRRMRTVASANLDEIGTDAREATVTDWQRRWTKEDQVGPSFHRQMDQEAPWCPRNIQACSGSDETRGLQ